MESKKSGKTFAKERANALLYRIAKALASVKDGRELLQIIVKEAQPVFGFYDIGLAVLDKSGEFYVDWAVLYSEISPSEANDAMRGVEIFKIPANEPLFRDGIARIEQTGKPIIEDLTAEFAEKYRDFPHLPVEIEFGYKQFLVTTLKFGGETFGLLNFNSRRENHFESCDLDLFQAIADLVAVAVANIRANEEIVERACEKEVLLSISQAIATIQNPQQLFKVIFERVQPIFGFHDVGLFVLSKDAAQMTDWAAQYEQINPSPGNRQIKEFEMETFHFENSMMPKIADRLAIAGSPIIFSYQEMIAADSFWEADFKEKLQTVIAEGGYREFLAAQLKTGGVMRGLLFFNSKQSGFFSEPQFAMFQTVADQIAVAVANIQANEEILEREREKSRLLEITELIAQVKANDDLLRLIVDKIKPLFGFEDCGLFVVSPDKETHKDLAALIPGVSPSKFNERIAAVKAAQNVPHPGSIVEQMMSEIEAAGKPVLLDFVDLVEQFPDYPQFVGTDILELGYRDCLVANLVVRGEAIGMFCINALKKDFFQPRIFPLFQAVAHSISIAVANILANEEILEREREKTVLLSISEDIAGARNAIELLQVIREKAQQLIPFHDTGILIVESDGSHHYDLSVTLPGWDDSEANRKLQQQNLRRIPHENSYLALVMEQMEKAGSPIIHDWEFAFQNFEHPFFPTAEAMGNKESIATTLKSGGVTFGTFWLNSLEKNSFSPAQFEVFQALADQVAVAVSNILANEEILEREREKSVLLSISEAIANIRDKNELWRVMIEKVQPLIGFKASVSTIYSADYSQYRYFLFSSILTENLERDLQDHLGAFLPIAGTSDEWVLRQPDVATLDIAEKERLAKGNPSAIKILKALGITQNLYIKLRSAGRIIGVQHFHFEDAAAVTEKNVELAKSITDLIATAIANILANEEILEREREKSVLLSISEDIASARNAVELMQVIRDKAQALIPFYDTGVLIVEPDGEHHYDLAVTLPDWDDSQSNNLLRAAGHNRIRHPNSFVAEMMKKLEMCGTPIIGDWEEIFASTDYPFFSVLKSLGFRESLVTPLKSGGNTFGTLWLNSLEKNHFHEKQFEIFQALADQVAVAVSNILANNEIKHQLAEIKELKKRLEAENVYLTEEIGKTYNYAEIVGASEPLRQVFAVIEQVAPTDATVLIQGETGTGKELVARAVHNRSPRADRPLIKINCAALPRELVESELFGHERGSFTGAVQRRVGKFELANNSTIFLDEIGELPLEMQVKLLRVLQEREIERLGGKDTIKLDLRVVAATNRNLAQEVQAGRFRADLYYRLCTVELFMPPLRTRRADIEPLTLHFAQKYAAKFSRRIDRVSSRMLAELNAYDFPGNIRELEHIVEHAVIFSRDEKLILPRPLVADLAEGKTAETVESSNPPFPNSEKQTLAKVEREHILAVLRQTSGRIKGAGGAAEILGLNPATVYFRMKKLEIKR